MLLLLFNMTKSLCYTSFFYLCPIKKKYANNFEFELTIP